MILKKIDKKRTKSDDRLEYTISVRSTAIFKYDKVVIKEKIFLHRVIKKGEILMKHLFWVNPVLPNNISNHPQKNSALVLEIQIHG